MENTRHEGLYSQTNLTSLQLLYWISQQMRPDSPFLNTCLAFHIHGELDPRRFVWAFQKLIQHSDAFRMVFDDIRGIPRQRVLPHGKDLPGSAYRVIRTDLSNHSNPLTAAAQIMKKRVQKKLDLAEAAFETSLLKLSGDHMIWCLVQHHLITDASAAFQVFKAIARIYEGNLDSADPLLELPAFHEYIDYEHGIKNSARYANGVKYWQEKLNPGPEPLQFYGNTPQKLNTEVSRKTVNLNLERSERLRQIVQKKEFFTFN